MLYLALQISRMQTLEAVSKVLTDIKAVRKTPEKNTAFVDMKFQSASVAADGSG